MFQHLLKEVHELDTTKIVLKKFGWTVGAVFGGIALLMMYKNAWALGTLSKLFMGLSVFLLVGGTLFPTYLKHIYRFWMGLSFVMGFFMSKIILGVLYFLLITPVGWFRRTFGKSPILTSPDDSPSYWIKKQPVEDEKGALERSY